MDGEIKEWKERWNDGRNDKRKEGEENCKANDNITSFLR